ncbi:MAG: OmpA family protein [Chitinophagaceae bacterium]
MKYSFLALGTVLFLLSSCGASKKLEQANTQLSQLTETNAKQAQQLTAYEADIKRLKEENIVYGKEAEACRIMEQNIRAKKQKLDEELAARGTSWQQIEDRAAKAVTDLRSAGCEVNYQNGRFYITVPDEFTFKSGSATVAPKGREALNVVAQIMYDNPGVVTTVVGNTDDQDIKGGKDNWALSTERANAVVRVLSDVYNINPKRLVAAGRSKFNPVASNDTQEGRASNRRIEIVINPRFDRILDLLAE